MATTFTKIASVTVGSGGAATIDFTSIPSTYTDLCLKVSLRNTADNGAAKLNFNGASSNFTYRSIFGDGGTPQSYSGTNTFAQIQYPGLLTTSNTFCNGEIYIPNYAGSSNKSLSIDTVNEANATTAYIVPMAYLWSNTAAITSISIAAVTSALAQYSTATLFGIKNS
jgi:hypothetical protein